MLGIWTTQDLALETAYAAVHIIDWGQTRHLARNPDSHAETNKLLGKHPSPTKVDAYFTSTLLAHAAITHILPGSHRPYWQMITIMIEGSVIKRNYQLGVHSTF